MIQIILTFTIIIDYKLGDGGGVNGGGNIGTWPVNMGLGGIILCQQWTRFLKPTREAASGVQHP